MKTAIQANKKRKTERSALALARRLRRKEKKQRTVPLESPRDWRGEKIEQREDKQAEKERGIVKEALEKTIEEPKRELVKRKRREKDNKEHMQSKAQFFAELIIRQKSRETKQIISPAAGYLLKNYHLYADPRDVEKALIATRNEINQVNVVRGRTKWKVEEDWKPGDYERTGQVVDWKPGECLGIAEEEAHERWHVPLIIDPDPTERPDPRAAIGLSLGSLPRRVMDASPGSTLPLVCACSLFVLVIFRKFQSSKTRSWASPVPLMQA